MDLEEDVNLDSDEDTIELNLTVEPIDEDETDEEAQPFDVTLAASHSYIGSDLRGVPGRAVLEAGALVQFPAILHHGVVFPGETVPMVLVNEHDAAAITDILQKDKLFGLLSPNASCTALSGYGVVCEVFEVAAGAAEGRGGAAEGRGGAPPAAVSFKARALHRFRMVDKPKRPIPVEIYVRLRACRGIVLGEVPPAPPLRRARLAALDPWRRPHAPQHQQQAAVRALDAALSPWPRFVHEMFDYARLRDVIRRYFRDLGYEKPLPEDPVSLSFWVASNLTMAPRDRLKVFTLDSTLLRLLMECRFIARKVVLCCSTCSTEIGCRDHSTSMSSDGLHGNYSNPGGFLHDILTVTAVTNTRLAGPPSTEFSWFPGYSWSVLLCACCAQHVGWQFDVVRRRLRPRRFYALCRNYVVPRDAADRMPPDTPPL